MRGQAQNTKGLLFGAHSARSKQQQKRLEQQDQLDFLFDLIKPVAADYDITREDIESGKIQVQQQGDKTILRLPDRTETLLRGKLHSFNAPARWNELEQTWAENNLIHRIGGPAKIRKGKHPREGWVQKGKYHRTDGPALIELDVQKWFLNNKYHRIGGPAIVRDNGLDEWYAFDEPHRTDGPAMPLSYRDPWNILFPVTRLKKLEDIKVFQTGQAVKGFALLCFGNEDDYRRAADHYHKLPNSLKVENHPDA